MSSTWSLYVQPLSLCLGTGCNLYMSRTLFLDVQDMISVCQGPYFLVYKTWSLYVKDLISWCTWRDLCTYVMDLFLVYRTWSLYVKDLICWCTGREFGMSWTLFFGVQDIISVCHGSYFLVCRTALRGDELWGVQRFLQAVHAQGPGLQVPRQ